MQTVTVHTSQNIDIDYEVADLGDRILAGLVDLGLFMLLMILCIILAVMTNSYTGFSETFLIAGLIVYVCMYVFYDLICEIFMNGQSIGKRVRKIKVISLDGAQPTVGQYLLRWLFRIVDFTFTSSLCGIISIAVSEKRQRVGDMVAGTTLIKTQPRTQQDKIAFTPAELNYEPVYNEASQLNDRDIELIHEVIQTYRQTGNTAVVYNMGQKISEYLSIQPKPEMDSLQLLQTIIKDYNYLVSRESVI
ncbi:RDD family protein [Mucilaginibacter sp. CSA2-8R]|uniref:RDD family protein n=1 Tax=Mucilaginibacter sp. CSA2-8R TaxID=3141542 RepID=UPI00315D79D2